MTLQSQCKRRASSRSLCTAIALSAFHAPTIAAESACISRAALNELSAAVQAAQAAPGYDKRFIVPRELSAFAVFEVVGAIAIKAKLTRQRWRKSGSGTLIGACHVLTSYHVVFPDLVKFDPAREVTFSFGVPDDGTQPFKYSVEGMPVDVGLYDPSRPVHLFDQVLIKLKARVPQSAHVEFASVNPAEFGADVYACGYPGELNTFSDRPQALFCDRCQVKGYHYLRGYETNCTMPEGTSGGAVFRPLPDAACDPDLKLALLGAPNQSPEPELFPKDHPRIRSFATDYVRSQAAVQRLIGADDCDKLPQAQPRAMIMRGYL